MPKEIFNPLRTVDSQTLMETLLPQPGFLIRGLLTEGVHILCGALKTGKSWMALWFCDRIAQGQPVWNFPTQQCDVLYLCLEDSYVRLQNRLYDIAEEGAPNLRLALLAGTIRETLPRQIVEFADRYPATRFVVIDTLQKIRAITNDNAYASDYSDISILKDLAAQKHLCILLIHHLRKAHDDDPFNMISGTNGITGAVDSSMVLIPQRRGGGKAVLHCTGRDIETRELELSFDAGTHRWQLLHDSIEEPERKLDPALVTMLEYVKQKGSFTGTATELLAALAEQSGGVSASSLSKKMRQNVSLLAELGLQMQASRSGERREWSLAYDGNDGNDVCGGMPGAPSAVSQPSQAAAQPLRADV